MKRSIKIAVAAAIALSSTSAFATNGDHLIGLGAKARGMGGVGIGMSHGAESALANPAMITTVKGTEISFGGTIFMPKVSANMGAGYTDSASDMSMIPEVSIASKISDNFYMGVGMWGTAGMGVDYRDQTGFTSNMNMVTNLQLMQFGLPMAYKMSSFSLGVTPIIQYGALDINYKTDTNGDNVLENYGAGVAQDLAFGYTVGASLDMGDLTLGAVYKSAIEMEYKGQLSSATAPFAAMGIFPGTMSDKLEQPVEQGVGASYKMGGSTVAVDYKQIKWAEAKGYKDFGWDNQNVLAVGYEYAGEGFAFRLGYNHAKNPIKDSGAMTLAQAGAAAGAKYNTNSPTQAQMMPFFGGNAMNMFNLLGFPATVESHYTVGGSFDLSKTTSLDLAYVYVPETTTTLMTMPNMAGPSDMSTSVKHSQSGLSVQVNYNF
ncbi:MAG: outer membrane protein transport protein [Sulfuricurvum sp.]|nr:outer membrane protein transport protein [Sulfuricurvum sp.]